MRESKELQVLTQLMEATRQGKVAWSPLVDPKSYEYVATLPGGGSFILTRERTQVFGQLNLAFTALSGGPSVTLLYRDSGDRTIMRLSGYRLVHDRVGWQLHQLFDLVRAKTEEPLDHVLEDLRALTSS